MCSQVAVRELTRYLVKEAMVTESPALQMYVRLALVTETPARRAAAYLRDTGGPEAAEGRLLLRAAERSMRRFGDVDPTDYEDRGKGTEVGEKSE